MIDLSDIISDSGSDLTVSFSILDSSGVAVVSGQTFQTNIFRVSTEKWWNTSTSAFDLGAEPALISGTQFGTTGIYQYVLAGGFDDSSLDYIIRLKGTGNVVFDFYASTRIIPSLAILALVSSETDWSSNFDGISKLLEYIRGDTDEIKNKRRINDRNLSTDQHRIYGRTEDAFARDNQVQK